MSLKSDLDLFYKRELYDVGLSLLCKYKPDLPIIGLLKSGENSFTRKKLDDAIEALANDAGHEPIAEKELDPKNASGKWQVASGKFADHPLIAELEEKRKTLFLTAASLHGSLLHVESNQRRFEIAKALLRLRKEIAHLWELHDYVLVNGKLPDDKPKAPESLDAFMKEYENVRINLTRSKNSLNKAKTDKTRNKAQARVDGYSQRLKELQTIRAKAKIIY